MAAILMVTTSFTHQEMKEYLKKKEYKQGLIRARRDLEKDPKEPANHYFAGRFLLALDRPEEALAYLKRAVSLAPEVADYHFWLGIAYWAVRDFDQERLQYIEALRIDSSHILARLYLGHNYLDAGEWKKALAMYDRVLQMKELHPEALYNRAMALRGLGRIEEEIKAWRKFLRHYPKGKWALRAAEKLNERGDFSFRNHLIGRKRVTLPRVEFEADSDRLTSRGKIPLKMLGRILAQDKGFGLHVIVYSYGNAELARKRALRIKKYILQLPGSSPG